MRFNISKSPSQWAQSCSLPCHRPHVPFSLTRTGKAGDEEEGGGKSPLFTGQRVNKEMQGSP